MSLYITGDIHGDVHKLLLQINKHKLTENDIVAVVGDVGLNFYGNSNDNKHKQLLNYRGVPILCIHGNHEIRPKHLKSYAIKEYCGGKVYVEEKYPNLLFAIDGEIYNIDNKKVFVLGGAYSVDKYYRAARYFINHDEKIPKSKLMKLIGLAEGKRNMSFKDKRQIDEFLQKYKHTGEKFYWYKDEQPSEFIKGYSLGILKNNPVDIILTHTGPVEYEPTEKFISKINQDFVDRSTENFLSELNKIAKYDKWFAGHYHTDKIVNEKFRFIYDDFIKI